MKNGFNKKGGAKQAQRQQEFQHRELMAKQDAEREERKKAAEGEEAKNEKARQEAILNEKNKIQTKRGTSRTIATSPQGVLGAAPTSKPGLTGTLGTRY